MKRSQKILLVIIILIASFSAYSLAQMNQVYSIDYAWDNGKEFVNDQRKFYQQWEEAKYPDYLSFDVITNDKIITISGPDVIKNIKTPKVDFNNQILLFAALGEVYDKSSIKIKDIAQKGNVVEVLVDISKPRLNNYIPASKSYAYDIVAFSKDKLQMQQEVIFVFKDYKGTELTKKHVNLNIKSD